LHGSAAATAAAFDFCHRFRRRLRGEGGLDRGELAIVGARGDR